jgi:hypothetical protein
MLAMALMPVGIVVVSLVAATESLLMGGLSASSCGKTVILVTHQARRLVPCLAGGQP